MSILLSSTESVSIDLVAMRNWHFHASMDKQRSPEMRRFHRRAFLDLDKRIPRKGPGSLPLVKVCLIELLAGQARRATHSAVQAGGPFDWKKLCEAVLAGLEKGDHDSLCSSPMPFSSCDNEGKAAAGSPQDAAANTSGPSEAKA